MNGTPERACLLIADISGYTSYLTGVELDHAQDILADLLGTVVEALRPRFRLSEIEGDAVFVFAPMDELDGSALLDTVEGCYFGFRRRLIAIRQASVCECNACVLIPSLDLKVVVHHGTVARQQLAGQERLMGGDVIAVHRLLKNSIRESLGVTAYAFLTDACLSATALDPETLGMRQHREEYEHVGELIGWVHDLEQAWQLERERRRVYIAPEDAVVTFSTSMPGRPELVWEYLTSPRHRPQWQAGVTDVREESRDGRRGVGTTNHCMHGEDATLEEILDWRPPRYVTGVGHIPGLPPFLYTDEVEPTETGVVVSSRLRPRRAEDRSQLEPFAPMYEQFMTASYDRLGALLAEELNQQAEPEPELPPVDVQRRHATAVRASS